MNQQRNLTDWFRKSELEFSVSKFGGETPTSSECSSRHLDIPLEQKSLNGISVEALFLASGNKNTLSLYSVFASLSRHWRTLFANEQTKHFGPSEKN